MRQVEIEQFFTEIGLGSKEEREEHLRYSEGSHADPLVRLVSTSRSEPTIEEGSGSGKLARDSR